MGIREYSCMMTMLGEDAALVAWPTFMSGFRTACKLWSFLDDGLASSSVAFREVAVFQTAHGMLAREAMATSRQEDVYLTFSARVRSG